MARRPIENLGVADTVGQLARVAERLASLELLISNVASSQALQTAAVVSVQVDVADILDRLDGGIVTPTPTPAPVFTAAPSIAGTPQVGQTLTGMDGTITGGMAVSRRWLLGGAAVASTQSYLAQAAGSLVYEVTASGLGGTAVATSAAVTVAAGQSATITSPASTSQPAATQRYQRATANQSGTWSKGSGGDAGSFTLDPSTGIYTINAAAAGDGSTQLIRTLPLVFTPADGTTAVTQTVTLTLAPIEATGSASVSYTADFTGAANTPLQSLAGWAVSGTGASNTPVTSGSGTLTGRGSDGGSDGTYATLYTPPGSLEGSRTTFTIARGATDDYKAIRVFAAASGYDNGVGLPLFPRATAFETQSSWVRQGGANTDGSGLPKIGYKDDDTIDIVFTVSADGNSLTVSQIGTITSSFTVDLTGKTKGAKFGFAGKGGYEPAFEAGVFVKAIGYLKALTTLTVIDAPVYSADHRATFTLSWAGAKPSRLQHRFYDADGNAVTPWMTGESVVSGTSSGTITYAATAPGQGKYRARFRPYNDTGVVAVAENSTSFFLPTYMAPLAGFNVGGANYYTPVPMLNDFGKVSTIRDDGSIQIPYAGITGTFTAQTPAGTTIGVGHGTMTLISSNPSTGTHRVAVNGDATDTTDRRLTWSGTKPAYLTITRDGQTGTTAPEFIAGMEGAGIRNLDMEGANNVPANGQLVRPLPTDKAYPVIDVGSLVPYQDQVDAFAAVAAVNPSWRVFWDVHGVDLSDADVQARATYQRDNLPTNAIIVVEFGNEQPWGTNFGGARRVMLDGVRKGYYGAATASAPQPTVTVDFDAGYIEPGNTASPASQAGRLIGLNYTGLGYGIWQAKQAVPAGAEIGENAYWTRLTQYDAVTAGRRWRSIRHDQIIEIYRSVFGATRFAAQVYPAVMAQASDDIGIMDQLVVERTFVPGYWDKVRGVGHSFYFDEEDGYNTATATAASLDASFEAHRPIIEGRIRKTVAAVVTAGKIPMFYEGMTHPKQEWYNGSGAYRQAWDTYFASDAGAARMTAIASFMKRTVPGIFMGFTLTGQQPWLLKKTWADTANKRRVGYMAGLGS